jgi:hypothetical protein
MSQIIPSASLQYLPGTNIGQNLILGFRAQSGGLIWPHRMAQSNPDTFWLSQILTGSGQSGQSTFQKLLRSFPSCAHNGLLSKLNGALDM